MKHSRNPELVAHIAAILLTGRGDVEPGHAKTAVKAAHVILDETHVPEEQTEPAADPAPAAAQQAGEQVQDQTKDPAGAGQQQA